MIPIHLYLIILEVQSDHPMHCETYRILFPIYHQSVIPCSTSHCYCNIHVICQATGSRLAVFCQSAAGIMAGVIIGFIYSWELTLCILGFAPLMLVSGFVQMKTMSGAAKDRKEALEGAGKVILEKA